MRVTSQVWVAALLRRSQSGGAFAHVARRGHDQAGSVFVIVDNLQGQLDLWAPAPQSAYGEDEVDQRVHELALEHVSREQVAQRLEKEARFDPDFWVVEIEDKAARAFLDF